MAIFDYRNYSSDKSAELATTTFQLAVNQEFDKWLGIDVDDLLQAGIDMGIVGSNSANSSVRLPENWSIVEPEALGLDASVLDKDGYYQIESPITSDTYSGPQVQILEERDASGKVTRVAFTFAGTNSPIDIADYLQFNTGEVAANLEPLLIALRNYAEGLGLTAENVLVTGYSSGGAFTNIMAKYADTLADGFFADSSYIGHASPYIYEDERVLNIGFENDAVFRATGNFDTLGEAFENNGILFKGQDNAYAYTTENMVLFTDNYNLALWLPINFSTFNLLPGWEAHLNATLSDTIPRITQSTFYNQTSEDSLIILSNLSDLTRDITWVEDVKRASDSQGHQGDSAFFIGSQHDDKMRGLEGNDYFDGREGDDTVRGGGGADRFEGGAGNDTLELQGKLADWHAVILDDGTTAFHSQHGFVITSNVESVTTNSSLYIPIISDILDYFDDLVNGDDNVTYETATQGDANDNVLEGNKVFGLDGNDQIDGLDSDDLLVGGLGDDVIYGAGGDDKLYGYEDNDTLSAGDGHSLLNGGLGSDIFVFDAATDAYITVEDFRFAKDELDQIKLVNVEGGVDAFLAAATETKDGVVVSMNDTTMLLQGKTLADITAEMIIEESPNPVATDDTLATTAAHNAIFIAPETLLGNDYDPQNQNLNGVAIGNAVNGTVSWNGTHVVFVATEGYSGPASFTYTIANEDDLQDTATVNLSIEAANETETMTDTVILGNEADNHLAGTDNDETIVSGSGNDVMVGGLGADVFKFTLDDVGTEETYKDQIIADFSDRMDLSDLLIDEEQHNAGSQAEYLDKYLNFSTEEGSTQIAVNTNGDFGNDGITEHIIEIAGYDATANNSLSDVQIITNLMNSGHLTVDS